MAASLFGTYGEAKKIQAFIPKKLDEAFEIEMKRLGFTGKGKRTKALTVVLANALGVTLVEGEDSPDVIAAMTPMKKKK